MPVVPFAVESAESRSRQVSAQLLQNLFVEKQAQGSKSPAVLFDHPGLTVFTALQALGPVRGFQWMPPLLYAVCGSNLYSISSAATATLLGSGITGSAPVSMATNGTQVIIVNGIAGWTYDSTNGFEPITSAAFYPADTVSFFDGYFVLNRRGTNQFFLSALYDGQTYNGLDFATAEAESDVCLGALMNLQLLFVICQKHIELWYDAGSNDFPFQRYAGGVINYGCVAPLSLIKQDGAIFFLGADKVFYRLQANTPIRISNHEIEHILSSDPDLSTAFCATYTWEGHKFVVLTLPNSNRTLIFDIATQKWHYRVSSDSKNNSLGRWRGNVVAEAFGKILVGDAFTGNVGFVDASSRTEYGNPISRRARTVPYHQDRLRVFCDLIELDCQFGVGLASGQGSDPQLMLRASQDGGETFGQVQQWRSIGKMGEYTKRVRWAAQGAAYVWVFEIEFTDPVPLTLIAFHAEMVPGMR